MLGAIIGDIVGSAYEFHPTNDYNFEMFKYGSMFTDDTICTVAIADALLKGRDYGESLHDWCRRYMKPKGGFGGRFRAWVESDDPQPYGSFGNGSAMRVSPIGMWFCNDGKKAHLEARKSAKCSHNHPEGIRGAQAVAQAICGAINTFDGLLSDREIAPNAIVLGTRILSDYGYDAHTDYENFRGKFDETCQGTVPPALDIIRKSTGFEDAVRKAVSLAADADTIAAIVGSIAEHIWGIPLELKKKAMSYLPKEMRKVVDDFYLALEKRDKYKSKEDEYQQKESLRRLAEWKRRKWMKECARRTITAQAEPYMRCVVAGTRFIPDQNIFYTFQENDMLTLKHEENKYDENAVVICFKDKKIGYVPRKQNADIAKFLKSGWEKMFLAYVSDWKGHGEKREITVDILLKRCCEQMPVDFDDSAEWWSRKMTDILDMGPRHAVMMPWRLWTKTYRMFAKGHSAAYDRPMEFVYRACDLCIEQVKDRYTCTKDYENQYIRFDRFKDSDNSRYDCFSFDRSAYESYRDAEEKQIYCSFGGNTGTLPGRVTPPVIERLAEDEVFVFGSNAKVNHVT